MELRFMVTWRITDPVEVTVEMTGIGMRADLKALDGLGDAWKSAMRAAMGAELCMDQWRLVAAPASEWKSGDDGPELPVDGPGCTRTEGEGR